MGLPSILSEQLAFNTRPEIEEHMLNDMHKSVLEEHLSQPLQTKNKLLKIAATFLICCNGICKKLKKTIDSTLQNELLTNMVLFK